MRRHFKYFELLSAADTAIYLPFMIYDFQANYANVFGTSNICKKKKKCGRRTSINLIMLCPRLFPFESIQNLKHNLTVNYLRDVYANQSEIGKIIANFPFI